MKIQTWSLADVKPYKANARQAKQGGDYNAAVDRLAGILREFGWQQPMVVDANGVLIIGHRRRLAAMKLGWTEGPVHVAKNLTAAQVRALRIADNRVHEDTEFDSRLLKLELADLNTAGYDLRLTALDMGELGKMMAGSLTALPGADPLAAPTENDENPTETVGDVSGEIADVEPEASPGPVDRFAYAVYRPSLNKKRTCRFLSVRKWRGDLKEKGLDALKAMKADCNPELVDAVAAEFDEVLSVLVGGLKQFHVTAPPSSKDRRHFATEIAKRFAERTGATYLDVFKLRPRKSSSHPAHWDKRGDMEFTERATGLERILLLDDVATSGTTIEQAVATFREQWPGAVIIPAAWLYGDVTA